MAKKDVNFLPLLSVFEGIVKNYLGTKEKVGMGICFTIPDDYKNAYWATNIPREESIALFSETSRKMSEELSKEKKDVDWQGFILWEFMQYSIGNQDKKTTIENITMEIKDALDRIKVKIK